jgi:nucleoside-diphosphate-sugar epimerase
LTATKPTPNRQPPTQPLPTADRPPQGKLNTEDLLDKSGVNWTSIRPVYIYGPLNYNPVEEFFFHRWGEGAALGGGGAKQRREQGAGWACLLDHHHTHTHPLSHPTPNLHHPRLKAGRPIVVPGTGMQVTQLGHVKDLSDAFVACLGNDKAARQVFNISGERFVTFDGMAKACAQAMGAPEPELVHFNPKVGGGGGWGGRPGHA